MTLYQYIEEVYNRLMAGAASPPPTVPDFPPQVVGGVSRCLDLLFVPENVSGGTVCLANVEEVRSEYRTTFTSGELLDYFYVLLHLPDYRRPDKEFLETDFPCLPYPKNAEAFWLLVKFGRRLRQLHLLERPGLEHRLHPFPITGSNLVSEPRFVVEEKEEDPGAGGLASVIGRIYINDSQYFGQVPASVWNLDLGTYLPAQKWLKDRENSKLETNDVLHYQKITGILSKTERLIEEMKGL